MNEKSKINCYFFDQIIKMSSSKTQSKLQDQLTNKINLLLDKPISPKSVKQLLQIINHPSSPKQRIFHLIQSKHRGQLMVQMLQTYPYIVCELPTLMSTFASLQKNITKYETEMVKQLYKLLIKIIYDRKSQTQNQNQEMIYKFGYEQLLKEGLKVTNLQKKEVIFELIQSNIMLFHDLGLKDSLRKVSGTFVLMFIKFPITVPSYVKVMGKIVQLIHKSNLKNDTQQQQKSFQQKYVKSNHSYGIKLHKLPEINNQYLISIITQLNYILQSTKQKPLYNLHNESLTQMQLILSHKGKQILTNDLIYALNKTLEIYLYRKGTRDLARKVSLHVQKARDYLDFANRQKMDRKYSQSNISQQLNKEPVLIEKVISKTNQFLAKYHVNNIAGNIVQNDNSEVFLKNSRFLKRGEGQGGGKTVLEINSVDKRKNINQQGENITKKKDKFELMLEGCLSRCEWEKNQKNPNIAVNNNAQARKQKPNIQQKSHQPQFKQKIYPKNKIIPQFQHSIYSQFYEDFPSQNKNISQINQLPYNNDTRDISEDQINEINQLIDLAYSYKFSLN